MSKGKFYSLEEARKNKDFEGFAKAHPSEGNRSKFENTLERMAKNEPKPQQKVKN
jgi:hypothetical protein